MARISLLLAMLLVVLTFNAYACILPVLQTAEMDCTSGAEEPVRGTCDAFLEIGPQSQLTSYETVQTVHLACALPVQLLSDTCIPSVRIDEPPRHTDLSIHCSIHTTVLRI
jgi:hypothetical protein